MVVVWKNKEMQNPTNIFLTSNAATEIFTTFASTAMVETFSLATRTDTFTSEQTSTIFKTFDSLRSFYILPILITMITLAVLAVERYNALLFPMRIHRRLNRRGAKIAIALTWIISTILTLPFADGGYIIGGHVALFYYLSGMSISLVVISSFVTVFCYGKIIFAIFVTNTVCNQLHQTCTVARAQDLKNKKNIVKMLLSITLIFVMTKFPPLSYTLLVISNRDPGFRCSILLTIFGLISALLNPVVYFVYSSNYRDGARALFRGCSCAK